MTVTRRRRPATEEKREGVLDATEEIMLEDGYAAVSSRSVAQRAGINPPLVHYYCGSLDDLFVAVLRRRADANVDRIIGALGASQPLRAWWRLAADPRGTALFVELMAAANHRPPLREAFGDYARRVREAQVERLHELLPEYGIDPEAVAPALVAASIHGLAFALVADEAGGYDTGTDVVRESMEAFINRLEQTRSEENP